MRNGFYKGHGLGNDYVVFEEADLDFRLTPARIRAICDRHIGVGADGVLLRVAPRRADFGLRIFNPDGGEAEKSGNGLRIFGRYLHATRRTRRVHFTVETRGGIVAIALAVDRHGDASRAQVEIGRASFRPADLPCTLDVDELVEQPIRAGSRSLRFTGVSVGNPHCVVFRKRGESWTPRELRSIGPLLETHRVFPRFCNVQLAVPVGARALSVLVWERGAGETRASGSSASAAASAAVRLGLVRSPVEVRMPGGSLSVQVGADFDLTLEGPVEEVARGRLADAFVRRLGGRG